VRSLCVFIVYSFQPHHGRAVCVDGGSAASGFGGWGGPSTGGPTGAVECVMAGVSSARGLLPPSGILVSPSPVGGGFRDAVGQLAMAGIPRRAPEPHQHQAIDQSPHRAIPAHATPPSVPGLAMLTVSGRGQARLLPETPSPKPWLGGSHEGLLRARPDDVGENGAVGKPQSHLSLSGWVTVSSPPRLLYGLSPKLLLERE
jgi:hypothetical protein